MIRVTALMDVVVQPHVKKQRGAGFYNNRITNMTEAEHKNEILTDAELDAVVGGLNPQPLPPEPPPEALHSNSRFLKF